MTENVLLSVKPQFVQMMVDGTKKVELRKSFPHNKIEKVFLYESMPSQIIRYYFIPTEIVRIPKNALWNKVKDICGLSREEFTRYFAGKDVAIGIFFDEVKKIKNTSLIDIRMSAPQNYAFLEKKAMQVINNRYIDTGDPKKDKDNG